MLPKKLVTDVFTSWKDEDVLVLIDWCQENGFDGWALKFRQLLEVEAANTRFFSRRALLAIVPFIFNEAGIYSEFDQRISVLFRLEKDYESMKLGRLVQY